MSERARGQWLLGLVAVALVVAGLVAVDQVGPEDPEPAADGQAGEAMSGAWYCPHGGGEGWAGRLFLANPGTETVAARVTGFSKDDPSEPQTIDVEPGSTVTVPVRAESLGASTMVEYFGGWIAAGWGTEAGGDASGAAAEPCAPDVADHYYLPDGTTDRGHTANAIIMNPFDSDAVFTVTVTTQKGRPIILSEWRDFVLRPHHSVALELNEAVAGESAVGAIIDVRLGRVAAASLGTLASGGVRSVVGVTEAGERSILPGGLDTNSAMVEVMNTSEGHASLNAAVLTDDSEQTGAGIQGQTVEPGASLSFSVITSSPSSLDITADLETPGGGVVATRRTYGISGDFGATAGVTAPGPRWVVLPAVTDPPYDPRLLLTNPGEEDVKARLTLLGAQGKSMVVPVPARRTVLVPTEFTRAAPTMAVLVEVDGGGGIAPVFVAYSEDGADYAVATGTEAPAGS